ncbi:MAG: DUF4111 domain-containing protein [Chloroflexi bacterium]|nr:DUF4111 domain-containing protein [Chloroflexota bacterium]
MPPTSYPELNQVLAQLVSRMAQVLGDELVGVYLQGSFALGGYDEHSDVDFVAIEQELAQDQVDRLQAMHDQVYQLASPWAQHLEGSYFPRHILRDGSWRGTDLWYLDHGARSLIRSNHCNTLLVRWIVREKGVALYGPPAKTLVDPVPQALLRAEMLDVLTDWGQAILDDPRPYNNRFYQSFIVLSYCRFLHDLHRGYPGSKRAGAEWAKSVLDPEWWDLIDRAWKGRPDPARQVREPADREDFARTLHFVAHIMEAAGGRQYDSR